MFTREQWAELNAEPAGRERREARAGRCAVRCAADADAVMATADSGFSFYDDLRTYLMEGGMKREEIAFIHDYPSAEDKSVLFDKVNGGEVRVLIGSTPKLDGLRQSRIHGAAPAGTILAVTD